MIYGLGFRHRIALLANITAISKSLELPVMSDHSVFIPELLCLRGAQVGGVNECVARNAHYSRAHAQQKQLYGCA